MDGKNNSSRSFTSTAEEPCGRKESNPSTRSSPGYFSTVIPPASTVIAKDLSHSDLCWTLNNQRTEGRSSECKSQGSPTKRQNYEDGKSIYPNEYTESPYFGSSVYYGTRDFYTSSSSTKTIKTSDKYKPDEGADIGNIHVADRGEWWQDCKSQGSPTKRQYYKDGKSIYPNEYTESPYFGSSVYYGTRDFYTSSSSTKTTKTSDKYKPDEGADIGNIHHADRGEWWQECKSQGSPTKRQNYEDGKSIYPNEYTESPYFGSSVYYGTRDFYTSSSSTKTTKTSDKYKPDEGADIGNIHEADRGEWWQGSLYY